MHLATHLPRSRHATLPALVLGAVLCLASACAFGAAPGAGGAPGFAAVPANDKAVSLKLDLGLAMSGDDCEEDYADLQRAAARSGAPAKPAQAAPVPKPLAPVAAAVVPAPLLAPVAAPPPPPAPSWEVVPSDKTLNAALARWAATAGWQLVWELPADYAVTVRTEIRGSFTEAVEMVAKSMETAEMPMKAIFYDGNRVLRIVAKGAQ